MQSADALTWAAEVLEPSCRVRLYVAARTVGSCLKHGLELQEHGQCFKSP